MEIQELPNSIKMSFIRMVLGEVSDQCEYQLKLFTSPELRKNTKNAKTVHKNGVKRCPQLNHFTGATSMFMNLDVLKLSTQPEILKAFASSYNVDVADLTMCYGPPSLLIKPENSGISPPFVYSFGKDHGIRYTGLMSLTQHAKDVAAAGVQKLANFDTYYDLLSIMYDFASHCTDSTILYLEKWFSLENANQDLEEYSAWYNFQTYGIPVTLPRLVGSEIINLYSKYKIAVPKVFTPLHWIEVPMPQGELKLFSSREAIKTLAGKDKNCARLYVQIPIQIRPETWEGSDTQIELMQSYKTGRFGDWHKPGKRCYLRENKSEHQCLTRDQITEVWSYVQQHKTIFGISN